MAFSEKLNEFYCRFERNDVKENLCKTMNDLKAKGSEEDESDEVECSFVESVFRSLKIRKAAGPDNTYQCKVVEDMCLTVLLCFL